MRDDFFNGMQTGETIRQNIEMRHALWAATPQSKRDAEMAFVARRRRLMNVKAYLRERAARKAK